MNCKFNQIKINLRLKFRFSGHEILCIGVNLDSHSFIAIKHSDVHFSRYVTQ